MTVGALVLGRMAEWVQRGLLYADKEIATQEALASLGIWDAEVLEGWIAPEGDEDDTEGALFFDKEKPACVYDNTEIYWQFKDGVRWDTVGDHKCFTLHRIMKSMYPDTQEKRTAVRVIVLPEEEKNDN